MNKLLKHYMSLAKDIPNRKGSLSFREAYVRAVRQEPPILDIHSVTRGFERVSRISPGMVITYSYNATTKGLPYWDMYPLVMVTQVTATGWFGLNLHYLHPQIRARVLWEQTNKNVSIIDNKKSFLAMKQYNAKNVVSKLMEVPQEYFEYVIQMPYEKFQGASKTRVWRDTRRKK